MQLFRKILPNWIREASVIQGQISGRDECLKALIATGINEKDAEALLDIVAKNGGDSIYFIHKALQSLAETVIEKGLDKSVINIGLLTTIATNARWNASWAYRALEALAEADAVNEKNEDNVEKLFTTISGRVWTDASLTYQELRDLAKAVKEKGLDKSVVLNMELLNKITENSFEYTNQAYLALQQLAESVKKNESDSSVLDKDFLISITANAKTNTRKAYNVLQALVEVSLVSKEKKEEIKTLLITIASQPYAASAYSALEELIKSKDLDKSVINMELLNAIATNAESEAYLAYIALQELAKSVEINQLDSSVLDIKLLISACSARHSTHKALNAFQSLAEAKLVNSGNVNELVNLIPTIAENAGEDAGIAFKELKYLVESKNVDKSMLDISLLNTIAVNGKHNIHADYQALKALLSSEKFDKSLINPDLLTAIATNSKYIMGSAFYELKALIESEDLINREVLNSGLLNTIAAKTGVNSNLAFRELKWLAESKMLGNKAVLNVNLLTTIAANAGSDTNEAYKALKWLAESVKINELSGSVLDIDLLTAIAANAGKDITKAYKELQEFAIFVKDNGLDISVLDKTFLTTIAVTAKGDICQVFQLLKELAKTANDKKVKLELGIMAEMIGINETKEIGGEQVVLKMAPKTVLKYLTLLKEGIVSESEKTRITNDDIPQKTRQLGYDVILEEEEPGADLAAASVLDNEMRRILGDGLLYKVYTSFVVNWELVFSIPVLNWAAYLLITHYDPSRVVKHGHLALGVGTAALAAGVLFGGWSILVGALFFIGASAYVFSGIHKDKEGYAVKGRERAWLFGVGTVLTGALIFPCLIYLMPLSLHAANWAGLGSAIAVGAARYIISHSVFNILIQLLRFFKKDLPNWVREASVIQDKITEREACFKSLTAAGVDSNAAEKLLDTIDATASNDNVYFAYKALQELLKANAVKQENMNDVVTLFTAIAPDSRWPYEAYQALEALAKAGAVKENDMKGVTALFTALANNTVNITEAFNKALPYKALISFSDSVRTNNIDRSVIDIGLLTRITAGLGFNSHKIYRPLQELAKFVKDMDKSVLDPALLAEIALHVKENTGEAYQVLGELAEEAGKKGIKLQIGLMAGIIRLHRQIASDDGLIEIVMSPADIVKYLEHLKLGIGSGEINNDNIVQKTEHMGYSYFLGEKYLDTNPFSNSYLASEIKLKLRKNKTMEQIRAEFELRMIKFEQRLTEIDLANLTEEEEALLYNVLNRKYPSFMRRTDIEKFTKDPLTLYIMSFLRGDEFYLEDTDKKELIELSYAIDEAHRQYVKEKHSGDPLWETSFREMVIEHREFTRWFFGSVNFKNGKIEVKNALQYFILTVLLLYGGMYGKELEEFTKNILIEKIKEHFGLFAKLALGDKSTEGVDLEEMVNRLTLDSFKLLGTNKDKSILWGVKSYQRTYYSLLRNIETGYPSLFVLDKESHKGFDESLNKIVQDTQGEAWRVPLSNFSDRSDIFGMDIPTKKGEVKFVPGVLPRLINRAQSNKGKPVYLVFDNIEAAASGLRVEFNPVLWERRVVIPELGKSFVVPDNLHIIFTMGEDAHIKDDAFLNRVLRQRGIGLDADDLTTLLVNKIGIEKEMADRLAGLYTALNKGPWKDKQLKFYIQDIINIAVYEKGRGGTPEQLKEEAYKYIRMRLRYEEDRKRFAKLFESIFGYGAQTYDTAKIDLKEGAVLVDGVEIEISDGFKKYIKENEVKSFRRAVLGYCGYSMGGMEEDLFSQFVRQLKFGNKDSNASLFTVIEGASGEGKTQFLKALSSIIGYKNIGHTIHRRSSIEELRGGIFPEQNGGLKIINDTPTLEAEREGRSVINYSELNTSDKQSIAYWLHPEMTGQDERLLPEIPADEGYEEVFYRNPISRDNIYAADINPGDYAARGIMPERERAGVKTVWLGYDYGEKDKDYQAKVHEEMHNKIKDLCSLYSKDKPIDDIYISLLTQVWCEVQEGINSGKIRSMHQVLTLRDIIRTIKLHNYYLKQGKSTEEAFKEAVTVCLGNIWHETEPKNKIATILKTHKLYVDKLKSKDIVSDMLKSDLGHILLHSNSWEDGYDVLNEVIAGDAEAQKYYMNVSRFIELDTIVGGASVDAQGNQGVFYGALLKIIKEASENSAKAHYLVLDGFHQLNPDTAVGLNKALQDGILEVPPELAAVWKGELVEGRYIKIPDNLKIVGISYTSEDPSLKEKLPMSGAELSRLANATMTAVMDEETLEEYINGRLAEAGVGKINIESASAFANKIFKLYVKELKDNRYLQARLSKKDIEEYVNELLLNKNKLSPDLIENIAYYTLGIGLREGLTRDLKSRAPPDLSEFTQPGALAEIDEVQDVYASILSAFRSKRNVILLEGLQGAGKTVIAEDVARRLGYKPEEFWKSSMYKDAELWDYIGKIEKTGAGKFRLTAAKKDGKYLTKFLDLVKNGGVYCFDEGNISENSVEILSFLMQIARCEEIELGIYHNGIKIGEEKIPVSPKFKVFVTFNPADITKGRKQLKAQLNYFGKKIWVRDDWSEASYLKFIDHYLENPGALDLPAKQNLIKLHTYMKYMMDPGFKAIYKGYIPAKVKDFRPGAFSQLYTYQYGVSPREIVRTIEMVDSGRSIYEGILLNYLYQFSNAEDMAKVEEIICEEFPGFKEFMVQWKEDKTVKIVNGNVVLGGTVIQGSKDRKDLSGKEKKWLDLHSGTIKALTMALNSTDRHTLLLSEQGSMPYELVKEYAEFRGAEMDVYNGHKHTTMLELSGGEMVEFGELDESGIAKEAGAVKDLMGFLGRHLVPADSNIEPGVPMQILYLTSLEMVPSEELEAWNDFLNTGRIEIAGKKYKLPSNVKIVVNASVLRTKLFSSPFYNRFQKIGIKAVENREDVGKYLDYKYPGLTQQEIDMIYGGAKLAWYMDMGRYNMQKPDYNRARQRFGTRYGFSMKEIDLLAEIVLLEKTNLINKGSTEIDSVNIVLKSLLRLYGAGLNDIKGPSGISDRDMYMDRLLKEVFNFKFKRRELEKMLVTIRHDLRDVKIKWVEKSLAIEGLGETWQSFNNGIMVKKEDGNYIVKTPANIHKIKIGKDGLFEKSEGLKIEIKEGRLILHLGLIESIGGIETACDEEYAMPPEEVPHGDYIKYTGAITEIASMMLLSSRRLEYTNGSSRGPMPVLQMGETGGAKSTLIRNFGHILGIPINTLHCFEHMEPDVVYADMSVAGGQNKELTLTLKEFFSHFGKIDGKYYYPNGKKTHAGRKILFLDETNVTPELLYSIRELLQGKREFNVYLSGEMFRVELDPEVIVELASNPAGRYEGRGEFAWEILEGIVKLWMPVLHKYKESTRVTKKAGADILLGMYSRKMRELEKGSVESEGLKETVFSGVKLMENAAPAQKIAGVPENITYKTYERTEIKNENIEEKKKPERPKEFPKVRKNQTFKCSHKEMEAGLKQIAETGDRNKKYQLLLDTVLNNYFLALGEGSAQIKNYTENTGSLTNRVLTAAKAIDPELAQYIEGIVKMYSDSGKAISLQTAKNIMNSIRELILKRGVRRFPFSFEMIQTEKEKLVILFKSEKIIREVVLTDKDFEELGINKDTYKDKLPVKAYSVEKHPFLEEAVARGVFKGKNYAVVYEKSTLEGLHSSQDPQTLISWCGYHELGHRIEEMRVYGEQITANKNVELFSSLFPIIFSAEGKRAAYIEYELLRLLSQEKDKGSYYCQAAKGIFNGFLAVLKEEGKIDKGVAEITNYFEQGSIDIIWAAIKKLKEEEVKNIAIKLYKESGKYLSSAEAGKYKGKKGGIASGDSIGEYTDGLANPPDVDTEELPQEEQKEIENKINIESDAEGEKEETPKIINDKEVGGMSGEEGGEPGRGGSGVVEGKWFEKYCLLFGSGARKFIDIFAVEPKEEETYASSGRKLVIRRWITSAKKVFKKTIYEEESPQVEIGVTIDRSGSILGKPGLVTAFNTLTKFFISLMYVAGRNNTDVSFTVSSIGEDFTPVVGFDECRDENKLEEAPAALWRGDSDGINTINLINGLRKQYASRDLSKPKVHFVHTDGGETAFKHRPTEAEWKQLRDMVNKFEEEYGVELVFIGLGTEDVKNYNRYIVLEDEPKAEEFVDIITNIAIMKVTRGKLLEGDLVKVLNLTTASVQAMGLAAGSKMTIHAVQNTANTSGMLRNKILNIMDRFRELRQICPELVGKSFTQAKFGLTLDQMKTERENNRMVSRKGMKRLTVTSITSQQAIELKQKLGREFKEFTSGADKVPNIVLYGQELKIWVDMSGMIYVQDPSDASLNNPKLAGLVQSPEGRNWVNSMLFHLINYTIHADVPNKNSFSQQLVRFCNLPVGRAGEQINNDIILVNNDLMIPKNMIERLGLNKDENFTEEERRFYTRLFGEIETMYSNKMVIASIEGETAAAKNLEASGRVNLRLYAEDMAGLTGTGVLNKIGNIYLALLNSQEGVLMAKTTLDIGFNFGEDKLSDLGKAAELIEARMKDWTQGPVTITDLVVNGKLNTKYLDLSRLAEAKGVDIAELKKGGFDLEAMKQILANLSGKSKSEFDKYQKSLTEQQKRALENEVLDIYERAGKSRIEAKELLKTGNVNKDLVQFVYYMHWNMQVLTRQLIRDIMEIEVEKREGRVKAVESVGLENSIGDASALESLYQSILDTYNLGAKSIHINLVPLISKKTKELYQERVLDLVTERRSKKDVELEIKEELAKFINELGLQLVKFADEYRGRPLPSDFVVSVALPEASHDAAKALRQAGIECVEVCTLGQLSNLAEGSDYKLQSNNTYLKVVTAQEDVKEDDKTKGLENGLKSQAKVLMVDSRLSESLERADKPFAQAVEEKKQKADMYKKKSTANLSLTSFTEGYNVYKRRAVPLMNEKEEVYAEVVKLVYEYKKLTVLKDKAEKLTEIRDKISGDERFAHLKDYVDEAMKSVQSMSAIGAADAEVIERCDITAQYVFGALVSIASDSIVPELLPEYMKNVEFISGELRQVCAILLLNVFATDTKLFNDLKDYQGDPRRFNFNDYDNDMVRGIIENGTVSGATPAAVTERILDLLYNDTKHIMPEFIDNIIKTVGSSTKVSLVRAINAAG
ncbi:MAG: hypothetical protein LHV68_13370 [Elusimicrobia bacterium]|nr:hypothetical protein [Candidatus Liberimonas magnetica]